MEDAAQIRSWLIVEPSLDVMTVRSAAADRIVLDLAGVSEPWDPVRDFCSAWEAIEPGRSPAFLLAPFSSGRADAEADIAVRFHASAVILGKTRNGAEVQRLDVVLRVAEMQHARAPGSTKIIALADAAGILSAASFERCSERLSGLSPQTELQPGSDGARLARATIALAASAANLPAIDALSPLTEEAAFQAECVAARANGFAGKLCRQPWQIPIINRIFSA